MTSKTPKRYKQYAINIYRYHSKTKKSIKIEEEISLVTYYTSLTVLKKDYGDKGFIIPPHVFAITKALISIEILCCKIVNFLIAD